MYVRFIQNVHICLACGANCILCSAEACLQCTSDEFTIDVIGNGCSQVCTGSVVTAVTDNNGTTDFIEHDLHMDHGDTDTNFPCPGEYTGSLSVTCTDGVKNAEGICHRKYSILLLHEHPFLLRGSFCFKIAAISSHVIEKCIKDIIQFCL